MRILRPFVDWQFMIATFIVSLASQLRMFLQMVKMSRSEGHGYPRCT